MISFLRMVTRLFIVVVFAMSINTGTVKYEIFMRNIFRECCRPYKMCENKIVRKWELTQYLNPVFLQSLYCMYQ